MALFGWKNNQYSSFTNVKDSRALLVLCFTFIFLQQIAVMNANLPIVALG